MKICLYKEQDAVSGSYHYNQFHSITILTWISKHLNAFPICLDTTPNGYRSISQSIPLQAIPLPPHQQSSTGSSVVYSQCD